MYINTKKSTKKKIYRHLRRDKKTYLTTILNKQIGWNFPKKLRNEILDIIYIVVYTTYSVFLIIG
jgi:hypothetical protein